MAVKHCVSRAKSRKTKELALIREFTTIKNQANPDTCRVFELESKLTKLADSKARGARLEVGQNGQSWGRKQSSTSST